MAGPVDEMKQHLRALAPQYQAAEALLGLKAEAMNLIAAGEGVQALILRKDELQRDYDQLAERYQARKETLQAEFEVDQKKITADIDRIEAEGRRTQERVQTETRNFIAAQERDRETARAALEKVQKDIHAGRQTVEDLRTEAKRVEAEELAAAERRRAQIKIEMAALETERQELQRSKDRIAAELKSIRV